MMNKKQNTVILSQILETKFKLKYPLCDSSIQPRYHTLAYMEIHWEGPSTIMVIKSFKILLERRLRRLVLIRVSAENPLSQSTVDIGKRRPMVANLLRFGNIAWISILLNMWPMRSQGGNRFNFPLAAKTLFEDL